MTTNSAKIPLKELLALNLLASVDKGRYDINGVYIDAKPGRLMIVATDGTCIGMLESAGYTESTFKTTIPKDALDFAAEMKLADAECVVSIEPERGLALRIVGDCNSDVNAVVIETKPVDALFPNWQQVMPREPLKACEKIILNRSYLEPWASLGELLGFDDELMFLFRDDFGPVEVVWPHHPEFCGLMMPMKIQRTEVPKRLEWIPATMERPNEPN